MQAAALGFAMALAIGVATARTQAPQPAFRGGTDLVQVDVSVLDGKRRPVRGLGVADFTLLVDGQPREIQAFTEVNLPDRVSPGAAPWLRDVPSDVVSNQAGDEEGRLVLIVLDRTIPVGPATSTARRTAAAIVEQLGPGDLAAVVSTSGGAGHNLTGDRGRLLRAINQSDVSAGFSPEVREIEEAILLAGRTALLNPLNDGRCLCGLCVPETITRAAEAVQSTARRRKLLFFIGSDLVLQSAGAIADTYPEVGCELRLEDARNAMFRALDRANVTVHSLDPSGLNLVSPLGRASTTLGGRGARETLSRDREEHMKRQGALRVLPERTGGRTIVDTNDPDLMVDDIFRESDSYYLIGFRPAEREAMGSAHTITVKARQRGVTVRARDSYVSAPARDVTPPSPDPGGVPPTLRASLTGLLPASDGRLDLQAAAFATPGSSRNAVTITVGIDDFIASLARTSKAGSGGLLEIIAAAFDLGGRPRGVARQTLELSWPQSAAGGNLHFDVLSRLDLPAGDYELRVGVSRVTAPLTASVFSYVTVPAFDSAPLSLSSIVLAGSARTLSAPKDFLADRLPIVPTARRTFAVAETLVGFLRLYEGTSRQDPLLPVQLRSSIVDANGAVVTGESRVVEAARFTKNRTADHYFTLPLTTLRPGDYLLRVEATMGVRTAGRAIRFTVAQRP
jgi:VWFA-related protein